MAQRWNVLLIMADQLTASALRAYGNTVCRTPNLDRLAARGTVFEQHYCNFPLCAPSRASMLTGRLASRIGAFDNSGDFPSRTPTIAHHLAALGYRTCLSGKMHFVGPDQLHGFRERLTTDIYPSDFCWTATEHGPTRAASPVFAGMMGGVTNAGSCRRNLQIDYDEEVCHRAEQWIYDHRRVGGPDPFFLTVSFTHPHPPFVAEDRYWDLYRDEEIDAPRVAPIAPEALDAHSLRLHRAFHYDDFPVTADLVRRARHAYYANISYVDAKVGRLLDALQRMDLDEQTVVAFTADHGEMLGERGMWFKWTLFEGAMRVPLILSVPGQAPSRIAAPVSLVDLLPTLVDVGRPPGHVPPLLPEIDGTSLLPAVLGRETLSPDRTVYAEMTADGTCNPGFMVRRGDWKLIACEGDPPQLYDLAADPDERTNLAGTQEAGAVQRELEALLAANWSPDGVRDAMIASARERLFVHGARAAGATPWDFEPRRDPSTQYIRSGAPGPEKTRMRYPPPRPR